MSDNTSAFSALEYDEKIKKTIPYYEDFYKQITDVVKTHFNKPLTWLDIGCGTGKTAETAFMETDIEKFIFCDNSVKMMDIVRKRFKNKNAEFITASFPELNTDIRFDVITAVQVFHYLSKEQRMNAVKKCYELLTTNGIFITFENFAPYNETVKHLFLERWKKYQLSQGRSIKECDEHIRRYGKEYFPISISEHLGVLKDCGFDNAEILWVSNMQAGLLAIK